MKTSNPIKHLIAWTGIFCLRDKSLRRILPTIFFVALFLSGCVTDNRQPLVFEVKRAFIPKEPQSAQTPTGLDRFNSKDPLKLTFAYKPIPLKEGEVFLVVELTISNVSVQQDIPDNDIQLIDGKGAVHTSYGIEGERNSWMTLADFSHRLDHTINDLMQLYIVPADALTGSVIKFQKATYPLAITNQQN